MTDNPAAAKAFGDRIRLERGRRWRTQEDFATAMGYRPRTVVYLETGAKSNFSAEFKGAVEAALWWEIGDFDRVRAGADPNRNYPPELVRLIDLFPDLDQNAREALVELAERLRRRR